MAWRKVRTPRTPAPPSVRDPPRPPPALTLGAAVLMTTRVRPSALRSRRGIPVPVCCPPSAHREPEGLPRQDWQGAPRGLRTALSRPLDGVRKLPPVGNNAPGKACMGAISPVSLDADHGVHVHERGQRHRDADDEAGRDSRRGLDRVAAVGAVHRCAQQLDQQDAVRRALWTGVCFTPLSLLALLCSLHLLHAVRAAAPLRAAPSGSPA